MHSTTTSYDVFDLLSSQRRRYVIWACSQLDPPIETGELAEHIAAWEERKPRSEVSSEDRRRVYTSLQQTHLPKLNSSNIIEYERETITATDGVDNLEVYLEAVPEGEIPWAQYYVGLSAIAAGVTAGFWVGIYPEWIPSVVLPTLIVTLFGLSAVGHLVHTRRNRLSKSGPPPEVRVHE